MDNARVRVAVYVTRESHGHQQVLVFDHQGVPQVGTRVPAGGVDLDERLDIAARREVAVETGVTVTRIGSPLAVQQRPTIGTGEPRVTVFSHATTDEDRDAWTHRVDHGPLFDCFFVPLAEARTLLSDHQGEFVDLLPRDLAAHAGGEVGGEPAQRGQPGRRGRARPAGSRTSALPTITPSAKAPTSAACAPSRTPRPTPTGMSAVTCRTRATSAGAALGGAGRGRR